MMLAILGTRHLSIQVRSVMHLETATFKTGSTCFNVALAQLGMSSTQVLQHPIVTLAPSVSAAQVPTRCFLEISLLGIPVELKRHQTPQLPPPRLPPIAQPVAPQ